MRSSDHRRQSGQSLVEAIVASALVAIAVVAGLQTLDAAVSGARSATNQAWARCVARGELEAVGAAAWSDGPTYLAPAHVTARVTWSSGTGQQALQKVVVTVVDPSSGQPLGSSQTFLLYKAAVISGATPLSTADVTAIGDACSPLVGP
jgi:Tfp pilus assembly protein PilV